MNKWLLATVIVFFTNPVISLGSIIRVPDDFHTIQEAINSAEHGDIISVGKGVYTGNGNKNLDTGGKAITVQSLCDPLECIIDCEGEGRGFCFNQGETTDTVISGFTIIHGKALQGGAIYCKLSSPKILNCIIDSNTAELSGGGMYIYESNPMLEQVVFKGNTSTSGSGGGIYNCSYSNPILSQVVFIANTSNSDGGGMSNFDHSAPIVTNSIFIRNSTQNNGGGISNRYYSSPKLSVVLFQENKAAVGGGMANYDFCSPMLNKVIFLSGSAANSYYISYGGGLYNFRSNPVLVTVIFANNVATKGGGVYSSMSSPEITNALFMLNNASSGGGMYSTDSWPVITNATFVSNFAAEDGGAIRKTSEYSNCDDDITITNSIFWANTAGSCGNQICGYYSDESISYCIYQGGARGLNNLNTDPCFVDSTQGNFHLMNNSPAIDAGNNDALPEDIMDENQNGDTFEKIPFDIDDGHRVINNVVDIGVFEFALKGDIDDDNDLDLADLILTLKVLCGEKPDATTDKYQDVNSDDKIGPEEAVYILQQLTGIR